MASFEAGGPYDFYARLIARFIGSHLPGSPNVVVQNMPGAGGLRGANFIYNLAPRDGTVMGSHRCTVPDAKKFASGRLGTIIACPQQPAAVLLYSHKILTRAVIFLCQGP